MPVRNAGDYLIEAVASILQQTHAELELIIIDDHSSDGAIERLPCDPRLVIVPNFATGLVAALNTGLAIAKYPFIARMDGDDIAHPDRLFLQINFLLDEPHIDIVGAKVQMFCDSGSVGEGYRLYEHWINQQLSPEQIEQNFFIESCIPHPTAMLRRDLLRQLGGYQDCSWPEDYDLWCRAFIAGKTFAKPDTDALLRWRDHALRASRSQQQYNKQQFLKCKAFYLSAYLRKHQINDVAIWGAGPTGLKMYDYLLEHGIEAAYFIDINPRLAGRQKRNKEIKLIEPSLKVSQLDALTEVLLIAVSARGARDQIRKLLEKTKKRPMRDYVFLA